MQQEGSCSVLNTDSLTWYIFVRKARVSW